VVNYCVYFWTMTFLSPEQSRQIPTDPHDLDQYVLRAMRNIFSRTDPRAHNGLSAWIDDLDRLGIAYVLSYQTTTEGYVHHVRIFVSLSKTDDVIVAMLNSRPETYILTAQEPAASD
jgi:hypothetical protein